MMEKKATTRRSCRITKSNEESPYIDGQRRKRKNSVPPVGKPKMPNKQKSDEYCFICHQLVQDLTCRACSRAYHTKCVKKKHIEFNTEDSCGECQAQLLNGGISIPGLDMFSFSELLEMVLEEALKDGVKKNNQKSQPQAKDENVYFKYFTVCPENSSLCQTMDLSILVDNIKKKYFLSTAEFFSHVKWMYHNSYILYGVHSEFTQTALKLEKNIRKEILDLEACAECYYYKHKKQDHRANFFTRLCVQPHDIVWAKLRGSPYWPAKCMRISNGHADVSFFGTHDRSSIPLAQCYRISEISPNDKSIKQSKYHDAIEELEFYLDNYRAAYKSFPYFPLRTPLVDSDIVTPKKPNKRGRHRKSPSSKQNDSFASEVNSPSAENMEPFKDVQTKLDTSSEADSSLSLNNCEMKGSKLPTKRSTEPDPVSVSMTFTEDEAVSYNHISTPSTHINVSQVDSSMSREYLTPVTTSCSPMLVETPDFLPSTGTTLQNSSKHFINSGSSNFPVIASVTTNASLNSTFSNELPEISEEIHNFSNAVKNHANILNSEKDLWGQQSQDITMLNYDDDDDEVQVIHHVPPKLSKSLKSIVNNPVMVQTFCQVLFRNKPKLQGLYNECLKLGHKAFIEFWLATVVEKHGENQVAIFAKVFDKVLKEKEALEKEKSDCILDLSLYRKSYEVLQESNDQLKKDYKLLQKDYATVNEERNNAAKVALFIRDDLKLEELQKLHARNLEKNKELQDQLDETKIILSKKEEELKEYMDKVLQLEDKLKSLKKPSCANSECQTMSCDLSENQLYTAHHFEEFKHALQEQSCSKHNLTKDDVIEKIEFTRQTITKDDYSGDLEVTKEIIKKTRTYEFEREEDEGPPVTLCPQIFAYPQLYGNPTFSLECAMGPPSTVVSSIHPTSVILNPDYMSQQSNIVPMSSPPKRYKNKKRN